MCSSINCRVKRAETPEREGEREKNHSRGVSVTHVGQSSPNFVLRCRPGVSLCSRDRQTRDASSREVSDISSGLISGLGRYLKRGGQTSPVPGKALRVRVRVLEAHGHRRTGDMYPGIGMPSTHGPPAAYEPSLFHSPSAPSPVYVPTTRVTPMIPALPYLQTHGPSQQQSGPVVSSGHAAWAQTASEAPGSSYQHTANTHHHSPVSPRFAFSASPPLITSGMATAARETATYTSPLNISPSNGREAYGATRGLVGGTYHSSYPAYVSPNLGGTWSAPPFDSSVLHSLQPGAAGITTARHPHLGKTPRRRRAGL